MCRRARSLPSLSGYLALRLNPETITVFTSLANRGRNQEQRLSLCMAASRPKALLRLSFLGGSLRGSKLGREGFLGRKSISHGSPPFQNLAQLASRRQPSKHLSSIASTCRRAER